MRRDRRVRPVVDWRANNAGDPPDPRFSFANERTFLAWNRTAVALVAVGLAIAQLTRLGTGNVPVWLGVTLIVLGALVGLTGFGRWRSAEAALRRRAPLPRSRLAPSVLGVGVGAVAAAAVVVAIAGAVS